MHSAPPVTLLYPPFCLTAVDKPHLGLPTLAGYLTQHDIACETIDLNVRFFRWIRSPGGAYDARIITRIARFRALQLGQGEQESPEAITRLFHELAGAPLALLERELGDHVLANWGPDPYKVKESLPFHGLHQKLENVVWQEIVTPYIAHNVPDAIAMHETMMSGPFGQFLALPEIEAAIAQAERSSLIGISISFSIQLAAALALARYVKARAPKALVALGGSQVTLLSRRDLERMAALPFVDAIGLYEGEIVLEKLHQAAQGALPLANVPSIVFRDAQGAILSTEPVRPVAVDDLPLPIFNERELHLYRTRGLPLNVTRGCYWGKCTFCDYVKLMAPGQSRYIGRQAKHVVDDVVAMQARYGTNDFSLITEALPPAWAAAFCKELLGRGVRATFWSYLKNEKKEVWSQDLLCLMSAAGIKSVTCGVESTSDRVLRVIDKGTTQEIIKDNYQRFTAAGIRAGFNLIPDYPTTTLAEAADGVRFVMAHRDIIPVINPQMFELSIQSAVAGSPEQFGIEVSEKAPQFVNHGAHSLSYKRTQGLADDERTMVADAYEELDQELARYHLTAQCRAVLGARSFRWETCSFLMEPSRRTLRSEVSMSGERLPVLVISSGAHGAESVEVPTEYARVIDLLTSRNRGLIAFQELVRAYTLDILEAAGAEGRESDLTDDQRADIFEACTLLVTGIAEGGTGRVFADLEDFRVTDAMGALLDRAASASVDSASEEAPLDDTSPRRLAIVAH